MAEAVSPPKRSLSQEHTEGVVKKRKADSPNASLNSENLQNKLSSIINRLNEDRENDQLVIDEMKTRYEELCASQMERLNDKLQTAYKDSEDPVNQRIEMINSRLETIRQLEADIEQFKSMLGKLHSELVV